MGMFSSKCLEVSTCNKLSSEPWTTSVGTVMLRNISGLAQSPLSSENMDIINNLYDLNIDRGKFGSPHRDLYDWPTLNNIEICVLSKFQESWRGNGNTDLIRAVFENCEYNEKGFVGIENLRKIRTYPKGTRFWYTYILYILKMIIGLICRFNHSKNI